MWSRRRLRTRNVNGLSMNDMRKIGIILHSMNSSRGGGLFQEINRSMIYDGTMRWAMWMKVEMNCIRSVLPTGFLTVLCNGNERMCKVNVKINYLVKVVMYLMKYLFILINLYTYITIYLYLSKKLKHWKNHDDESNSEVRWRQQIWILRPLKKTITEFEEWLLKQQL